LRTFPTGGSLSYNATLRPERLQFSSVLCRGMRMFRSGRFALPCIPVYCRCDSRECTEDENRKRARSCLALLHEGLRIFHLLFFFSREWQRGASGLYAGKYYCLAVPIIRIGLCSGSILTPCRLLATDTSCNGCCGERFSNVRKEVAEKFYIPVAIDLYSQQIKFRRCTLLTRVQI